jgi:hypothetical protein
LAAGSTIVDVSAGGAVVLAQVVVAGVMMSLMTMVQVLVPAPGMVARPVTGRQRREPATATEKPPCAERKYEDGDGSCKTGYRCRDPAIETRDGVVRQEAPGPFVRLLAKALLFCHRFQTIRLAGSERRDEDSYR